VVDKPVAGRSVVGEASRGKVSTGFVALTVRSLIVMLGETEVVHLHSKHHDACHTPHQRKQHFVHRRGRPNWVPLIHGLPRIHRRARQLGRGRCWRGQDTGAVTAHLLAQDRKLPTAPHYPELEHAHDQADSCPGAYGRGRQHDLHRAHVLLATRLP
jgi:hypothetical protein